MTKGHMEAFSDGVFAVIITIMVLELKSPQGTTLAALKPLIPVFFSYVLSFIYVGIYWNNHHHLLQAVRYVAGDVLWANLHLLFWLSLIPAATGWLGHNFPAPFPTAVYGVTLLMPAIAYYLLQRAIIHRQGAHSVLAKAVGNDLKGKLSPVFYSAGIVSAFYQPWISIALYVLVAAAWLVPDRRIERLAGK